MIINNKLSFHLPHCINASLDNLPLPLPDSWSSSYRNYSSISQRIPESEKTLQICTERVRKPKRFVFVLFWHDGGRPLDLD